MEPIVKSNQNIKIIIEGPNAVGKSTISKELAKRISYKVNAPFSNRRDLYDLWFSDPKKALEISIDILSNYPSYGIFDRYHLTPQTMMNHPLLFLKYINNEDIIVSLDAETSTLKARQNMKTIKEDVDPDLFYKPHYARLSESWNALYIDSTHLSINDVVNKILLRYNNIINNNTFLVKEGRSKRIWRKGNKFVIELKPSLDSYTHGKSNNIIGTEVLRNQFFEKAIKVLSREGVPVLNYQTEGIASYSCEYCYSLPFEFIVKMRAVGTTLIDCPGLFYPNMPFPTPVVRFDYRTDPRDMPVPSGYLLNFGLDPTEMAGIAEKAVLVLSKWLSDAGYELIDICFIFGFSKDEKIKIISEISPDCMRVKRDGKSYDKDLFRQGASDECIKNAWKKIIKDLA